MIRKDHKIIHVQTTADWVKLHKSLKLQVVSLPKKRFLNGQKLKKKQKETHRFNAKDPDIGRILSWRSRIQFVGGVYTQVKVDSGWKMLLRFNLVIFWFHVNFQGCSGEDMNHTLILWNKYIFCLNILPFFVPNIRYSNPEFTSPWFIYNNLHMYIYIYPLSCVLKPRFVLVVGANFKQKMCV